MLGVLFGIPNSNRTGRRPCSYTNAALTKPHMEVQNGC